MQCCCIVQAHHWLQGPYAHANLFKSAFWSFLGVGDGIRKGKLWCHRGNSSGALTQPGTLAFC